MQNPSQREYRAHAAPTGPLAIRGGQPVVTRPPRRREHEDVLQSITQAVEQGDWASYAGDFSKSLRSLLRELHGCEFVRLCASGTVGIELALKGVGVAEGKEVVLAGYDFPGNFRCIEQVGARPVLVDVDPTSGCLSPHQVRQAFGASTAAVVASHLHGALAPMAELSQVCAEANIPLVEDACQAPSALVHGRLAGTWGDAAVFSFGGSKLISAGRGGAVISNCPRISQRMKVYSERGNDAYPLSELQAAALVPQWRRMEQDNDLRRQRAFRLHQETETLDAVRWIGPTEDAANQPSYYKVGLLLASDQMREHWALALQAEGVLVDAGFRGFAKRSNKRCRHATELACAEVFAEQLLVLHHSHLEDDEEHLRQVASAILKVADRLSA